MWAQIQWSDLERLAAVVQFFKIDPGQLVVVRLLGTRPDDLVDLLDLRLELGLAHVLERERTLFTVGELLHRALRDFERLAPVLHARIALGQRDHVLRRGIGQHFPRESFDATAGCVEQTHA